jgi:hypothetical protein
LKQTLATIGAKHLKIEVRQKELGTEIQKAKIVHKSTQNKGYGENLEKGKNKEGGTKVAS